MLFLVNVYLNDQHNLQFFNNKVYDILHIDSSNADNTLIFQTSYPSHISEANLVCSECQSCSSVRLIEYTIYNT